VYRVANWPETQRNPATLTCDRFCSFSSSLLIHRSASADYNITRLLRRHPTYTQTKHYVNQTLTIAHTIETQFIM